jgi:DNA repair exonuclease SbcCD nuclease subunit
MSDLQKTPVEALAILTGDWHLDHDPPRARAETRDEWYEAQAFAISGIRQIVRKESAKAGYKIPVIISGDIFNKADRPDKAANPSRLVNSAIRWIGDLETTVCAVPGQHDLPNHNYANIRESPYWTLVEADTIVNLAPGEARRFNSKLGLVGYPWGYEPQEEFEGDSNYTTLCVIHKYIWHALHKHPKALPNERVDVFMDSCSGFDAFVAGDNHSGFLYKDKFFVNGTLMRRNSDEIDYNPWVGVLYSDGHIETRRLDVSRDKFRENLHEGDKEVLEDAGVDYDEFVQAVRGMTDAHINFKNWVLRAVDSLSPPPAVRSRITRLLEERK